MNIKPSGAIRNNYNEIAELCKTSGEPVYLTKKGEGDLVVMDLDSFVRKESMLRLLEGLLTAEGKKTKSIKGFSLDDVSSQVKRLVQDIISGKK
jgi:PHD/YefM family antitoxin component YafN of YafNO toxin-antitoxin module